jgi:hypothetical protein
VQRFAVALLLLACHSAPSVPVNQQLWRTDGPWVQPASNNPARKARATILVFRSDHEFVELHCWLIEQPDTTLYISSTDPRVMIVGRWEQRGSQIEATRQRIAHGAKDPLCKEKQIAFRISGTSVIGNAGGAGPGSYSVVTRLVAPDFEFYVKEARESPVTCD